MDGGMKVGGDWEEVRAGGGGAQKLGGRQKPGQVVPEEGRAPTQGSTGTQSG